MMRKEEQTDNISCNKEGDMSCGVLLLLFVLQLNPATTIWVNLFGDTAELAAAKKNSYSEGGLKNIELPLSARSYHPGWLCI